MLFEYAAHCMTCYPGDVLTTGTLHSVDDISHGDTVTIEMEKLGRMWLQVKARGW